MTLLSITTLIDQDDGAWIDIHLYTQSFLNDFVVILWSNDERLRVCSVLLDKNYLVFGCLLLFLDGFYF